MPPATLKNKYMKYFCALIITLLVPLNSVQAESKLTMQQQAFLDGWDAIKRGDRSAIANSKKQLQGHALLSYIQYHDYRRNINSTPDSLVLQFFKENPNHLSRYLRKSWLKKLAKNKQWPLFLANFNNSSQPSLQCYFIQALIDRNQSGDFKIAVQTAQTLWSEHAKLPKACYPVDDWLRDSKNLTAKIVWKRISLAIEKRKFSRAKVLMRDLSNRDQAMVKEWIRIVKNPYSIKKPLLSSLSQSIKNKAFLQAAQTLARKDPQLTQTLLTKYRKPYRLTNIQVQTIERRIALRAAYRYKTASKQLLNLVNTNGAKTEETLRWQAQIALKQSNWLDLKDAINLMPAKMQSEDKWQYWKARSLGKLNQQQAANKIYNALAKNRNYYGFLAADKLDKPYRFNPKPKTRLNRQQLFNKYPALERIQQLMAVDWKKSSYTEWHHLLKEADENDLTGIAVIANEWRQHPHAIRSLAVAKQWDQLELRFPTPHKQPVMINAQKNKIDPAWIYGIIRRESAFNPEIRSPAGAVGLMQLMPKTAKYIGRQIGIRNTGLSALTRAKNNIELGSAYMAYLSKKYDNNMVLATAAYNAGPHRVKRWTKGHKNFPADQWVDTITFSETRAYVKAVLEYTTIFKSRLSGKYDRLRDLMPRVSATQ